jgi:hypothetical protein
MVDEAKADEEKHFRSVFLQKFAGRNALAFQGTLECPGIPLTAIVSVHAGEDLPAPDSGSQANGAGVFFPLGPISEETLGSIEQAQSVQLYSQDRQSRLELFELKLCKESAQPYFLFRYQRDADAP